jgi:phage terminase large subunit GpA-like protein
VLSALSAEPGPWRTDRVPYLRAIMDALGPGDSHETVVLMKGAQIGATEAALNFLGFAIEHAGGVVLLVMPSLSDVLRNTRVRIDPMIAASTGVTTGSTVRENVTSTSWVSANRLSSSSGRGIPAIFACPPARAI